VQADDRIAVLGRDAAPAAAAACCATPAAD